MASFVQTTGSEPDRKHVRLWYDASVVVLATLLAGWICAAFDVSERIFSATRRWEFLQLDELPAVLLALAAGLAWFAWRRYRESADELARRTAAERRLNELLRNNRLLARQHIEVQEAERKRLARELHDEAGQYLNAIKTDAVSIQARSLEAPEAIRRASAAIIEHTDRVYDVVRTLIRQLRPVGLDDLGLKAALEHYVDHWKRRLPHIRFAVSLEGDLDTLGEALSLAIYRFTQEGLINVARHAHARRVEIEVLRRSRADGRTDEVTFRMADDGGGADLSTRRSGLGLIGMRERAEVLGGELQVRSAPSRGFTILARIPVDRPASGAVA